MRYLLLKIFLNKEKGFTLIELLVVVIIVGISAALGISSLVGSQRQARANEALNNLRSALQSAQANANRMSTSCTVTVTSTQITAAPVGCIQENITIDSDIVDIASNSGIISFDFDGSTDVADEPTFFIRRKIGITLDNSNANCLVISSPLGLIRTGKTNGNSDIDKDNCLNVENLKYDNEN